eukprot:TRINITY_DN5529_c1_g1_i1.p1 TRINITY_DN5529_c1_g1~~TRINITY_DN5529_c1_g1_i1.p1  ORF type:complete len:354 (-),score=88.00 TRINITY_DN5529_c1_g1_i1:351-1379(-)
MNERNVSILFSYLMVLKEIKADLNKPMREIFEEALAARFFLRIRRRGFISAECSRKIVLELLRGESEDFVRNKLKDEPNETLNVILFLLFNIQLPIFPREGDLKQKEEIKRWIEGHTKEDVKELEERMRIGSYSEDGFLDIYNGDSFVETVWKDSMTLSEELKLNRMELVKRMEMIEIQVRLDHLDRIRERYDLSEETEREYCRDNKRMNLLCQDSSISREKFCDTLLVFVTTWGRCQPDPFYPTLDNPTVEANKDYYVLNLWICDDTTREFWRKRKENGRILLDSFNRPNFPSDCSVSFGNLNIEMIRQFCFFEGEGVSFRLDPRKLTLVLGFETQIGYGE